MVVRTPTSPFNIAELLVRLGGIPPERVRMNPPPGTATEADLLKPHGPTCELIDGVLVEKPMGTLESFLGMEIGSEIRDHVRAHGLGVVLGEAGLLRLRPGLLRAPD